MFSQTELTLPAHLLRGRLCGLYVITDERMGGGHLPIARAALDGGATIIQLRDKSTPPHTLIPIGHELRRLTRSAGALFLVNDRIDIALASDADGVHLGPDDMPIVEARRILGPHRLLGVSCANIAEAMEAERAGADYIGVGAIFGTSTKSDAGTPIGVNALENIIAATPLPVAAIGGINRDNIQSVAATGTAMICVISAIAGAGDEAAMTVAAHELSDVISH